MGGRPDKAGPICRIEGKSFPRRTLPARDCLRQLVAGKLGATIGKTGGRLLKHARRCGLLSAEGHLTRRLFGAMVRRIGALPVPAG